MAPFRWWRGALTSWIHPSCKTPPNRWTKAPSWSRSSCHDEKARLARRRDGRWHEGSGAKQMRSGPPDIDNGRFSASPGGWQRTRRPQTVAERRANAAFEGLCQEGGFRGVSGLEFRSSLEYGSSFGKVTSSKWFHAAFWGVT